MLWLGPMAAADGARASGALSRFEYDVFLSYSSRDRERAAAVVARLREEGLRVFWDRDVVSGALWRPALTRSLRASQCVLVLWSRHSQGSPWVQAEAELALRLGVFQHLLLDQIELDLPFGQYQLLADLSTWTPGEGHEALEQAVRGVLARIANPVASLEQSLVQDGLRRLRRRRQAQTALRVAAPFALLASFALAAGLLDEALGIDTRLRLLSVWARGALTDHRLHDSLTLIRIDRETYRAFGKKRYDFTWRSDLARAIKNLAGHGARVVALDLTLPRQPAAESSTVELAEAIRGARMQHGAAIVVGVSAVNEAGQPEVEPAVREALASEAPGRGDLGVSCGGTEGGFATTFPVLVSRGPGPPGSTAGRELLRSLSFATALAWWGEADVRWDVDADRIRLGGPGSVPLSGWGLARLTSADCPLIARGSAVAKLIIEQSPARDPWRHVVPFEAAARDQLTDFDAEVRGRICLIGDVVAEEDQHLVWSAGLTQVPGVKLQADAITTLLDQTALRRLSPFLQLLVILGLGTLAAACRLAVPPGRGRIRLAGVTGLVALDLTLAVFSAAFGGLFMDAGYHVLAVLASYWYAQRLEGRFFAGARSTDAEGT